MREALVVVSYLDPSTLPAVWHWMIALSIAAVLGSFLTVVTTRLPRKWRGEPGLTTLGGRSYCPHCNALIPIYRNIPVLTFLLQRGRTACCARAIPARYAALEAGAVVWAAALIGVFGFSISALALFFLGLAAAALLAGWPR